MRFVAGLLIPLYTTDMKKVQKVISKHNIPICLYGAYFTNRFKEKIVITPLREGESDGKIKASVNYVISSGRE